MNNPHQPDKNLYSNTEEEIDLKAIIYKFLANWYWFALAVFIAIVAGYYYYQTRPKIYESTISVLLRQEQTAPEEMMLFQDLGYNIGKNNMDNEIGVFKSPDLILKIVSSMELYTTYRKTGWFGFYTPELYRTSPLYVRMEDVEPDKIPGTIDLLFEPRNGSFRVEAQYIIDGETDTKTLIMDTLPGYLELPIGRFYVSRQPGTEFGTTPLHVTICNAATVARRYVNDLDIQTSTKSSTLLNIKFRSPNRRKGEDFILALVNEYNLDAIADKNTVAYNTSVFIDERLRDIALELGDVEQQVETFRREYYVTDIESQVGSYIRRSEGYETRRMEIETQLNLVQFIENFILNPDNRNKLIPNLGIKDPGLVGLINEYNTLLLNRERVEAATSPENPALRQLNQQVDNMHSNIVTSIANEKQASQIALRDLERENTITSSRIRNIPTVDRQFTDIMRQQEVKSNLFVYLLQKREETNITQAAVAPKAKIIARPHSSNSPVEPRKVMLFALFFMAGLAIPAIALFVLDFFQTKIEGMKELEKVKHCSVIGDIIDVVEIHKRENSLVVKPNDNSPINEMFRTMRNNLLFMTTERDQNIILVTSTIPGEGKTFISTNLARSLAVMDKKILLVGADLRNPKISRSLGIPKRETGMSSYLAGHIQDYNELIERVEPNFYVIQSGPIPPNPNEMLSKNMMGEFLNQVHKEFDYIVLDSAPVGVVSDTFLIAKYCHATLYVIRENFSEKDTIPFLNSIAEDKRLKNIGIVLNCTQTHTTLGRYRYNYKYSYRYRYGYAQGYGKDA